jgi:hypothetical protein
MNIRTTSVSLLLALGLAAQNVAIYPANYANVADGPLSSQNLPLANGTGRGQIVYEQWDLPVPTGSSITRLGFRQDQATTAMDTGRALQLEVRLGYTTATSANLDTNMDNNFTAAPVTVFGPAIYQLPNLRDTANPLPDGRFFVNFTTPFVYSPAPNQNLLVEYRVYGNSAGGSSFTYRLDRADYYSPIQDGPAGCPHSGGSRPVLALSPVRTGGQFFASISSAPSNSLGVLVLAVGSPLVAPYSLQPFVPGIASACQGQVPAAGALTLTGITSTSGSLSFLFNVPNQRIPYNDTIVGCQAALFDLFAPGGLVVSNGSQVQIGILPQSSIVWGSGPPGSVTTGFSSPRYCPVAFFGWQ